MYHAVDLGWVGAASLHFELLGADLDPIVCVNYGATGPRASALVQ